MYIELEVKYERSRDVFQRIGFHTKDENAGRAVFRDAETFLEYEVRSGNIDLDEDWNTDKYDADRWVIASLLLQHEANAKTKTLSVEIYSHGDSLYGFITRFRGIASAFGCEEVIHHVS